MTRKALGVTAAAAGGLLMALRVVGVDLQLLLGRAAELVDRLWLVALASVVAYKLGQCNPPRSRVRKLNGARDHEVPASRA